MHPTNFGSPTDNGGIFFHAEEHARPIPFRMRLEPAVVMDHDDMMASMSAPSRRDDDCDRPRRGGEQVQPRGKGKQPRFADRGDPRRGDPRLDDRRYDSRDGRSDDRRPQRVDDRRPTRYDARDDDRRPQRVDDRRPSRYDARDDDRLPQRVDDRRPQRWEDRHEDRFSGHNEHPAQHNKFLEGIKHTAFGVGGVGLMATGAGVGALGIGNYMHHAPAATSFGLLGVGAFLAVVGFAVMKTVFGKD